MTTNNNESLSFGTLLQTFRIRRHLTQQHLAKAVGVHRHTMSRWEQGDFLPASRGIVLELARHLHLTDQETRQLLEASLTALAPYWSVPFLRNPFFTGREEVLEALHAALGVNQTVALTQSSALHGLGGVGKTQIALEYAYRHALEYSAVLWIGAESSESILSSLLRVAEVLQLPGRDDQDQQRMINAVQRWLTTHDQWLLIWDNVEDLDLLSRYLPAAQQGAALITTRYQTLGTFARGLALLPMEREEGMLFLLRRARMLDVDATSQHIQQLAASKPDHYEAASQLVEMMGGLPLALDQAGAYLEETRCRLPAYVELFHTRRAALLQQRGERARDHPASVSTTFLLSLTATAEHHPAVRDFLQVCALLHPDAIPEDLFRQEARYLGEALADVCSDELEWNRMLAVACAYSLLQRHPEERMFSMHRLVQTVLLDKMTQGEREQWSMRVIEALDAAFPEVLSLTDSVTWRQGEQLLPHVLLCLHRAGAASESLILASLAYKTAQYLRASGRYTEAKPLFEHALQIREQKLGPEHPEVSTSLNYVAVLSAQQGKYAEAAPLFERALQIHERVLGPEHSEVAREMTNLAILCVIQGKNAQAEPLYQRALSIWERNLGPEHPHVASTLNNLAELYRQQGKYAEAAPLYQRALHIWEQSLGPTHLEVARVLDNLGHLSFLQGDYAKAEAMYQRALHIWEQAQASEHPDIGYLLNNLANLLREQGKDMQAEAFYQRALRIREQHLGPHHSETAQTLHDLAILRKIQGKLSEARSLAERARSIHMQVLGEAHPKTIATCTLLAQLVQDQGHHKEEEHSSDHPPSLPNLPGIHEQRPIPGMRVAVRGATEQVAYTRMVKMREVTFTCTICGQTVTQLHYPSGRIKYCSQACSAVSAAQRQQVRVARQREKRRIKREIQAAQQEEEP